MQTISPLKKSETFGQFVPFIPVSNPVAPQPAEARETKSFSSSEVVSIAAASAIGAVAIAGSLIKGKGGRNADSILDLKVLINKLQRECDSAKSAKELLSKANGKLEKEVETLKDGIMATIDSDLPPTEKIKALYSALKDRIFGGKLNYDPLSPSVIKKRPPAGADAIELPPRVPTKNRAFIKKLEIPEVAQNGHFEFEVPMMEHAKITKANRMDFTPVCNQTTNIGSDYAGGLQWNNDKIARDLLQNFYDGHGQTLDGVKIIATPIEGGKLRVRVEGKTTYTPDKALIIGNSTKRDNAKAAGNYGEGLKMAVLKLLEKPDTQNVRIASDNWKVTYKIGQGVLDQKVLTYSLEKNAKTVEGNFIEFETDDIDLVKKLRTSINRFYHSGNEHFKCPDFENELFGLKILPKGEKGGIYLAGQRFEFDNDFDGLKGMVLFVKEKLPVNVLDVSRDRTTLNGEQLEAIARWFVHDSRTTINDKIDFINAMKPYWEYESFGSECPPGRLLRSFLMSEQYCFNINSKDFTSRILRINFPDDKYVAYSNASDSLVKTLVQRGYVICKEYFGKIGMPSIKELMCDAGNHTPLQPTKIEEKKMMIIKDALSKLSCLTKHFSPEEIDTKIYLFDAKAMGEHKLNKETLAEAIIDNGTSRGFWIDRDYLSKGSFGDVLETALHEMSHKAGGDGSSDFGYKLTDVNAKVYEQLLNSHDVRLHIEHLGKLWEELVSSGTRQA